MAEERKIPLRIPETVLPGVYANQMVIRHTREEFVLDFINRFPPRGVVAARIIVSPGHLKRMIGALRETLRRHEEAHGRMTTGGAASKVPPLPDVPAEMTRPLSQEAEPRPDAAADAPPPEAPAEDPQPAPPAAEAPAPEAPPAAPAGAAPAAQQQQPRGGKQGEILAAMPEKILAGVYANQMVIRHSREEFLLDFINVFPPESIVTSRVFVSPEQIRRMLGALRENFHRYETIHGTIIEAMVPQPGSMIN